MTLVSGIIVTNYFNNIQATIALCSTVAWHHVCCMHEWPNDAPFL